MPVSLALSPVLWRRRVSTVAQRPADHGQVAYLPNGTSCSVYSHGGASDSVSCVVLTLDPTNPAAQPGERRLTLAVPADGTFTCQKPWVARLSETEFVACWERQVIASNAVIIECARIYQSEGQWFADEAVSGVSGHVIESGIDAGDADSNARCFFVRDGYFVVRYAVETANGGAGNPHTRTYTVKHGMLSWLVAGAPVSVGTKTYASQRWDDDDATPTVSGGYMLGEMRITSRGDFLSVWENRVVNGANFDSSIQYRLLAGLYHATPLSELATGTLKSVTGNDVLAYRRPRLMGFHPFIDGGVLTDGPSGAEELLLTYGLEDVTAANTNAAKLAKVRLYAGAALSVVDLAWRANLDVGGAAEQIGSSCVLVGRGLQCGIAVGNYDSNAGRALSVQHADGRHEWITNGTDWPDRPSGECWTNPYDGEEYAFLSTEGFNLSGGSATVDRFLELRKLVGEA